MDKDRVKFLAHDMELSLASLHRTFFVGLIDARNTFMVETLLSIAHDHHDLVERLDLLMREFWKNNEEEV